MTAKPGVLASLRCMPTACGEPPRQGFNTGDFELRQFIRLEAENPAVKIEFEFKHAAQRLGLAKPVALAGEKVIGDGQPPRGHRREHGFRLIGGHGLVVLALKKDSRAGEAVKMIDR